MSTRSLPARKGSPRLGTHSGDASSAGPEVPPLEVGDVGPAPVTASSRHVLPQRPPLPQTSARIVHISGHHFRTERAEPSPVMPDVPPHA